MKKLNLTSEFASRKQIEFFNNLYTQLPDPDKILKLNGYNYDIYRDLLNDPHLSAVIQQRKMQVLQMGWEIENVENEELKNEIMNIIKRLNLLKIGSEVLDALLFGFNVFEIMYKEKENKLIPVDLIAKPLEWFTFNKENKLILKKKNELIELPELKFILIQNKPTYENPYGEKLLSKVYWPIMFKRANLESWQNLSEKFGVPFLLGYYTDLMNETEKQEILKQIEEAIKNNIALFKQGTEIEFKENSKYEVGDLFRNMIELQNKEISKAILTVTLTTEVERSGSYKAAEIHMKMLEYLGLSDKKLIERVIDEMIEKYLTINFNLENSIKEKIRFRLKKKESIIETTIERDKILSEMGIKFNKEYFMKRYNLSENEFEVENGN